MRVLCFIFLFSLISFLSAAEGYSLFEENGKVGLKNQQGQVLIPAQYDALGWSDGKFSVIDRITGYRLNGQWGLINLSNQKVTKAEFTGLVPGDGLLLVANKKMNGSPRPSAGCINTAGKEVIPFQYDGLLVSSLRAVAIIRSGTQFKYGLIDLENKRLIPIEYRDIRSIGSLRYAVENFQGKTALFAESGKQITGFSIDSISSFSKNYAVIYQNLQQGLIDRDGQIKVEPKYRAIKIQEDGTIQARQPDEWFFFDGQNKLLQKISCDSIEGLEKNLFKLNIAGSIQLVDAQFKPISASSFTSLGKFENDNAIFSLGNKYGLIHKNGVVVIEPTFDKLINGKNFILANQRLGKRDQWILLDSLGNKKHTKHYERIDPFNGKFYPAKNHNFWGALDENGMEIIACVHDSLIQSLAENIVVKFHGQYGIMGLMEDWRVTPQPNTIKLISEDRYLEYAEPTTFLKSLDGHVIYFTENRIESHLGYLLEYLPSGTIWEIDLQGRIADRHVQLNERIEEIFSESEGLRAIKKDGKFGFIDLRGRLRIANRYEDVKSFSEKLAAIKILGKWGFINHDDKIEIQPVYDEVAPFQYGISIVKQKGFFGAINKYGKLILPPRYQALQVSPNDRVRLTLDGKEGLADTDGRLLISPKFDRIEDLDNGYVIVQRNQKYSLLTLEGLSTIPMIYDYLSYDKFNSHYIALKKSVWETIKP